MGRSYTLDKVSKKAVRRTLFVLAGLLILLICILVPRKPLFQVSYARILKSWEGELLAARIAEDEQWRFPYSEDVSEKYVKALVLYEDKRFFNHMGFDPVAMVRALIKNIKAGKIVSGGSTITMQVVRLWRNNPPRTIPEKILEIGYSFGLELAYSKREIIALYAAHAPYGGNIIGLETASWKYFGRSSRQLSWGETALLTVLPNSPGLIHPGRNREILKKKRNFLLRKLREAGEMDDLELKLALAEPLPSRPKNLPRVAGHLLDTLAAQYPEKTFYHSSIRYRLQKQVNRIGAYHGAKLEQMGIHNLAAVVIHNPTSRVHAYLGNAPFSGNRGNHGNAIDIVRSPRSTGSILKPLLYAAMLKDGEILPNMLISDIPTQYEGYMPENYDREYRGAVPAHEALSQSLNVPAVRMLYRYGLHRFYHFLKSLGMTTLFRSADEYGLTLILGGAETSLWDITSIYSNFSRLVQGLDMRDSSVLKDEKLKTRTIPNLGAGSAYLTFQALIEVGRPGEEGYWKNFSSSQKVAWKTGTSYGLKDGWAIGSTPEYTVGVWTGNADGEGRAGLTGTAVAAPIMFDIFNTLENTRWFDPPYHDLKTVSVCSESGFLASGHCGKKKEIKAPKNNHFSRISPYHRIVHLDKNRKQVHSGCESVENMKHVPWFVLPPVQEYFYQRTHTDYKPLPPYRRDCRQGKDRNVMSLVYPGPNARIYIPVYMDGQSGHAIFRAVHREKETGIYWHLDEKYLGKTKTFHEMVLNPEPGAHTLILVDENGNRLIRKFRVLGKEEASR